MILTIDIGTTVLKAAIFSKDGRLQKRAECSLLPEKTIDPLRHEIDAGGWIDGVRELTAELTFPAAALAAVAVSGNGPTLLPVGADDAPLIPALTWMDRRSGDESKRVSELAGEYIDASFYLPKALWIYRHLPRIYKETKYFFSCPEYINYLLTGVPATILPVPEYENHIWTKSLVTALGMDWDKFPDLIRPGERLGPVTDRGTEVFGIPAGVPVIAAGPDFVMSLLGTGTVAAGRVCDRSGTSEGINLCTDKRIPDRRLISVSHIIDGMWNISGVVSSSGKAMDWFGSAVGGGRRTAEMLRQAEQVPPGAGKLLFLPYLAGERSPVWDSAARGSFIGLTLNHGKGEMARAVAESVGFAVRDIITVMEELGLEVNDLRITGSQAKSDTWTQIKADITGKRFLVPSMKDAELIGSLCIALYALGRYESLAAASEELVEIAAVFEPDRRNTNLYDDLFSLYRESYTRLKPLYGHLSNI